MTDKEKDYIAENYKGFSDEVCDNYVPPEKTAVEKIAEDMTKVLEEREERRQRELNWYKKHPKFTIIFYSILLSLPFIFWLVWSLKTYYEHN
jgi:hypothetical protein